MYSREYFAPQTRQINSRFHSGAKDRSRLFRQSESFARRTCHFLLGVSAPSKAVIHLLMVRESAHLHQSERGRNFRKYIHDV